MKITFHHLLPALVWLALSAAPAQAQTFTLGTSNLVEGPAAGIDSVVLTANPQTATWTATANVSWLHLASGNLSGTGNTNVVFTNDANAGATRTGTLTIAGLTLNVTQAGSTYVAAGLVTNVVPGLSSPILPYGVAVDGAGDVYFSDFNEATIEKWRPTDNSVTTLVPTGTLGEPRGLAVDGSGNVYIADTYYEVIEKWTASNASLSTLVPSGLGAPEGVAVDGAGNLYIAATGDFEIKEWTVTNASLFPLVSGLFYPGGVAVDSWTNVYIADTDDGLVSERKTNGSLTTLVSTGNYYEDGNPPYSVAVDNTHNVYIAYPGEITEWTVANSNVTVLTTARGITDGVAVDGARNVYMTIGYLSQIYELPHAFVDLTSKSVSLAGTNDALPAVVPTTANLLYALAPTSDQPWLTITGITGGVVSYSVAPNTGPPQTAHIQLLGQTITVTQAGSTYAINTNTFVEGPAASSDTVILTVSPNTGTWSNLANSTWLHLSTPNQSGTGSASVVFTFDANPGGTRTDTLTIEGITVSVTQAGSTYVAAGSQNAFVDTAPVFESAAAGSDTLAPVVPATANLSGAFAPTSDQSWLTIGGITNDAVSFSFTANTGPNRTAHITELGQIISVTQSAPGYTLGTLARLEGPAAGSDSVVLAVIPGIASWTNMANVTWLHLSPANQNGTGSTNVIFSYDANSGATRTGTLTIAGQTLIVTQAGSTYVATGLAGLTLNLVSGLSSPWGVAVDGSGNLYFPYISYLEDWTVANNSVNYVTCCFNDPVGVAIDGAGNVYIADTDNNVIKEWNPTNYSLTTLVSGLNDPFGLAVDGAGNLYFSEPGNGVIEKWTAANSNLTTLVSSGLVVPTGVAVDAAGNVYITDSGNNAVKEWLAANDTVITLVAPGWGLINPDGVAVDGAGNVYISDGDNNAIDEWVAANNTVTTLVPSTAGLEYPHSLALDAAGNLYIADGNNNAIDELPYAFVDPTPKPESAAGGSDVLPVVLPATENLSGLFMPTSDQPWVSITGVTDGVVSFSFTPNTSGTSPTAQITLLGQVITITQPGPYSLGANVRVEGPAGGNDSIILAVSPSFPGWTNTANDSWLHLGPASLIGSGSTNIFFSYDPNPGATRTGTLTIAGLTLTVTQAGSTYVSAGTLTPLVSSGLSQPGGVAVDGAGNVYIADRGNNAIKEWSVANNSVTPLVSSGLDYPTGVAVDGLGNVYIGDTYNNAVEEWNLANGLTPLVSSGLNQPKGVAVDSSGNVYIADTYNYAIEEWMAANSNLTTLVNSGLNQPSGVAVDFADNVYIGDTYNYAVEEWNLANGLTPLVSSGLYQPSGVAVDVAGNVYIANSGYSAIDEWSAANSSLTPLVSYGLNQPSGVAVDVAGNVYIADTYNNAVEELPYAFVDPTYFYENETAGSDALPMVLPSTANLTGPFTPTSDQAWLTITGTAGGVVSFSFTANNGPFRTANISLLGQTIPVYQFSPNTYNIGAAERLEGPGAGSDSVVLSVSPNTSVWTATNYYDTPWLHLSLANQSGTGSTNVVFTFDANPGPTRTAFIEIAADYDVLVTQAGSTYVAAGLVTNLVSSGLDGPHGVAVDGAGNVYFADTSHNAIDEWTMASNSVTNLVSMGLNLPWGVAVDGADNVYFADSGNNAIRKWMAANSNVTGLVSGLNNPTGVAVDDADNVYFADSGNNAIKELPAGSSPLATNVFSGLSHPTGVTVDIAGNVYFADTGNNQLKKWTAVNSNVTTFVSSGLSGPGGVAADVAGNVYIADSTDNAIKEWTASGNSVTTLVSSGLSDPTGVAVDVAGDVYFADSGDNAIKERPYAFVDTTSRLETGAAGSDTLSVVLPTTVNLTAPFAPTSDQSWLTLTGAVSGVVSFTFPANIGSSRTAHISVLGQIISITQSAPSYTLGAAARLEGPAAGIDSVVLAVIPNISTWTATSNATWLHLSLANQSGTGSTNVVFSYDANPGATRTGTLSIAGQTLTITQAGSTYVAAGLVTILASSGLSDPTGVAVDGAGDVYFANTGSFGLFEWTLANNMSADLFGGYELSGVAVDGTGNVYFASKPYGYIFESASNSVSVLAYLGFNQPNGVAVDSVGNVYIADTGNNAIKEWTAANKSVSTLVNTGLASPTGVAVDAADNLYIADSGNNAIKEWTAANSTVTPLVSSGLSNPTGVAVDGAGNVYIADSGNNAIKKWTAASNSVSTLAPGLNQPAGVAVDGTGNVYIADSGNNEIKELPCAFVDPTSKSESMAASDDVLPVVLPATENLSVPFAPASDQSWLTISGVTNGVVNFAFSANTTSSNRTANISVLGQIIPVVQAQTVAVTPPHLIGVQRMSNGSFQFSFTNNPGGTFTVLSTTNLSLRLTNWTVVGAASNIGADLFQFIASPTNGSQRFYTIRSP